MKDRDTVKKLALQVLDAICRGDAGSLGDLLSRGAPPDGWWDAVESAERDRQLHRDMADIEMSLSIELGLREEATVAANSFMAALDAEHQGPCSFEIPLHLAAECDSVECLQVLLDAGADINKKERCGCTALFVAKSAHMVRLLADAGIDLLAQCMFGRDALRDRLEDFCTKYREEPQYPVDNQAVEAVCDALLEVGLPLIRRLGSSSRLYNAAFNENPLAVRFLLETGHPAVMSDDQSTALHAICWHWDYGDQRDNDTRDLVRMLLAAGIDASVRDSSGNTPLHECFGGDGINLVAAEELLKAGADINAVNDDSETALMLHYRTMFEYERAVRFALEHGASPLIRDRHGQDVIDIARSMIRGESPRWRIEQPDEPSRAACAWKHPATPGDVEYQMLALLERAAETFRTGGEASPLK